MPELRKDPITGRWVIISTDRGKRPMDFLRESVFPGRRGIVRSVREMKGRRRRKFWPTAATAPERNSSGWNIRVVPNRFPALGIEGELDREGEGLFDKMNGIGAHEVIIETPQHQTTLAQLPQKAVEDVLWAYRDRMLDLKNDKRFRYVLIFKNHGEAAGASVEHPHSQLIALADRAAPRSRRSGQLLALLRRKRALHFLRHHPPGARHRRARHRRKRSLHHPGALCAALSRLRCGCCPRCTARPTKTIRAPCTPAWRNMLKDTLMRMDAVLDRPAYNFMIHTSPIGEEINDHYHWHIEIIPKLTKVAGFEWGTGFYINPTPPEESARFLREAQIEEPVKEVSNATFPPRLPTRYSCDKTNPVALTGSCEFSLYL